MGGCCTSSDRKTPEEAARQLESLFILDSNDFLRKGNQNDMLTYYEVLESET